MISCIVDRFNCQVPQIILVYFNLPTIHLKDDLILAKRTGLSSKRISTTLYSPKI